MDLIVIDAAHGHARGVLQALRAVRSEFPNLPIIAGNVATAEGTRALIEAGADCVRVGLGAGSICTTRIISGVGIPQLTAIMDCAREAAAARHPGHRGRRHPLERRCGQGAGGRARRRSWSAICWQARTRLPAK